MTELDTERTLHGRRAAPSTGKASTLIWVPILAIVLLVPIVVILVVTLVT